MIEKKETETYGIFKNVDVSILKLNPFLKKDGYEFITIKYSDLEKKYPKLVTYLDFEEFKDSNSKVNLNQVIFLLKKCDNKFVKVEKRGDKWYKPDPEDRRWDKELAEYVRLLIIKLKISKSEQINFQIAYTIIKEDGSPIESSSLDKQSNISNIKFSINEKDLSYWELYDSGVIKKAEEMYRKAIDAALKGEYQFSQYFKSALDILPSGLERFYDINELSEILEIEKRRHEDRWTFGTNKGGNLILGFLYLAIGNFDKAYENLSNYIDDLNEYDRDELPYLLRSLIPESINPYVSKDVAISYFIRPSSRALYLYYLFLRGNLNKDIENYLMQQSIHSKNNIEHKNVYKNILGKILTTSPDPIVHLLRSKYGMWETINEDIIKSYSLDPNYLPAIHDYAFLEIINTEKRIECFLKLEEHKIVYPIAIANCYFKIYDYENALKYYEYSTNALAGDEVDFLFEENLNVVTKIEDEVYIPMEVYDYFEKPPYNNNTILNYFNCIIKKANPDFILGKGNPSYDKLIELRDSYRKIKAKHGREIKLEELINSGKISDAMVNANKLMLYKLEHKIGFGKHKNKKIIDVLNSSPDDIVNNILELIHFSVHPYVFLDDRIKANPKYTKALEVNLIKVKIIAEIFLSKFYETPDNEYYSDDQSYYDGGGGDEWSDPFQFWGG